MTKKNKHDTKNKGVAAPTTTPQTKSTKYNFKDNSAHNQRLKLLDWLFERTSITSNEAHEKLNIYHPPARIF